MILKVPMAQVVCTVFKTFIDLRPEKKNDKFISYEERENSFLCNKKGSFCSQIKIDILGKGQISSCKYLALSVPSAQSQKLVRCKF